MESPLWSIKYRPRKWEDFVGQDMAIQQLRQMAESGTCPHLMFVGPSGTGKTAAAEVFARSLLGPDFESNYLWLNVRDLRYYPVSKAKRSVADLAKLDREERTPLDEYMSFVYREAKMTLRTRGKSGDPNRSDLLHTAIRLFASTLTVATETVKILVLDEADAMDNNMQQALRRTMEIYGEDCRFILITPSLSNWIPAILSRCLIIHFPSASQEDIVKCLRVIAERENVSVDDSVLEVIARESAGDLRRAIDILQMAHVAASSGAITEDHVYEVSEHPLQRAIHEAVSLVIEGSFKESRDRVRKLLAIERYEPHAVMQGILRDIMYRPLDPEVRDKIIRRIAEIDTRITQAKNPFIHVTAVMASIWHVTSEAATDQDSTS